METLESAWDGFGLWQRLESLGVLDTDDLLRTGAKFVLFALAVAIVKVAGVPALKKTVSLAWSTVSWPFRSAPTPEQHPLVAAILEALEGPGVVWNRTTNELSTPAALLRLKAFGSMDHATLYEVTDVYTGGHSCFADMTSAEVNSVAAAAREAVARWEKAASDFRRQKAHERAVSMQGLVAVGTIHAPSPANSPPAFVAAPSFSGLGASDMSWIDDPRGAETPGVLANSVADERTIPPAENPAPSAPQPLAEGNPRTTHKNYFNGRKVPRV